MNFVLIYFIIAFIFLSLIYISEADSYSYRKESTKDRIATAIMMAIWPITVIAIMVMIFWDQYRLSYADKITRLKVKYTQPDIVGCINHASVKELKMILYAKKIGAYAITEKDIELVERSLTDKEFEKRFLKD